jgi:hypothetical protein
MNIGRRLIVLREPTSPVSDKLMKEINKALPSNNPPPAANSCTAGDQSFLLSGEANLGSSECPLAADKEDREQRQEKQ